MDKQYYAEIALLLGIEAGASLIGCHPKKLQRAVKRLLPTPFTEALQELCDDMVIELGLPQTVSLLHLPIETARSVLNHPMKCGKCEFRTCQTDSLAEHAKQHSTEWLYKCKHCSKGFNTEQEMSAHYEYHNYMTANGTTEIAPRRKSKHRDGWSALRQLVVGRGSSLYCRKCEKVLPNQQAATKHFREHKEAKRNRVYICHFCPMQFRSMANLENHIQRMHRFFRDDGSGTGGNNSEAQPY